MSDKEKTSMFTDPAGRSSASTLNPHEPAMPSSLFTPPCWLRNPHLQTLWPKFFRKRPHLPLTPERIELADGDFIDLSWAATGSGPRVLILHGLEGGLDSHYALPFMATLLRQGFHPVFMHLRGCSNEPNRLSRTYHSGSSDDLCEVLEYLKANDRPIWAAAGFSLGGNILLRYLGMSGRAAHVRAAAAISVPFELSDAARRLEQGGSRIYQHYLVSRLKRSYRKKIDSQPSAFPVALGPIRTLRQYDQQITAPLNGFAGADDYYARCSSKGFLRGITTPTLILHSQDDPFMYPGNAPTANQIGPGVRLAIQRYGGHVGFVTGLLPWKTSSFIDQLVPAFLLEQLSAPSPLPIRTTK